MPRPRKESTISVRIRTSTQGIAQRIAAENNLAGLADSIQAAVFGWDLLTSVQQADILGREVEEAEEDEKAIWVDVMDAYRKEFHSDD